MSYLDVIHSRFSIWTGGGEIIMVRPMLVRPLPNYRIYLEFSDGAKGEVDLSELAGNGVFEVWNDYSFFEKVHIGPERQIKWDDYIELCADSLYLKLTVKTAEEPSKNCSAGLI